MTPKNLPSISASKGAQSGELDLDKFQPKRIQVGLRRGAVT